MIKLISGVTQIAGTIVTPESGPFTLAPHDEQRLVEQGAAVYVQDGTAQAVATPLVPNFDSATGMDTLKTKGPVKSKKTGHLDPDQLQAMTNKQLAQLAADMGLDASKCKAKPEYITLITSIDVVDDETVEDGDVLPVTGAEGPVV